MSKLFESITPQLEKWISHQQMFFVATAPLSADGHINCSPKGLDSFRILSPTVVAYQDLTGSGIETIAHIQENKRILIMFCAFDGAPKIVRLHGHGKAVLPTDTAFADMETKFPKRTGVRAYIQIDLTRITDSCGYSVPLYDFKKHRDVLDKYNEQKGEQKLKEYRLLKNKTSIDGLMGLVE